MTVRTIAFPSSSDPSALIVGKNLLSICLPPEFSRFPQSADWKDCAVTAPGANPWAPIKTSHIWITCSFSCCCYRYVTQSSPESPGTPSASRSNIAVDWSKLSRASEQERPACHWSSSSCTNGRNRERLLLVTSNHTSSPMMPLLLLFNWQTKLPPHSDINKSSYLPSGVWGLWKSASCPTLYSRSNLRAYQV